MSKEFKDAYNKILNILYPGYSEMSPKRKDAIEFREMGITRYALQIDALFDKMKNPENSLYQPDASDSDIVNIAAIYARIHEESNEQIAYPTGKMLRGGDYYDSPVPEYEYRDKTEQEVQSYIRSAVKEYNSIPRISIINIIKGIKKYNIDYTTALNVSEILKEMQNNKAKENENMEMEK